MATKYESYTQKLLAHLVILGITKDAWACLIIPGIKLLSFSVFLEFLFAN